MDNCLKVIYVVIFMHNIALPTQQVLDCVVTFPGMFHRRLCIRRWTIPPASLDRPLISCVSIPPSTILAAVVPAVVAVAVVVAVVAAVIIVVAAAVATVAVAVVAVPQFQQNQHHLCT